VTDRQSEREAARAYYTTNYRHISTDVYMAVRGQVYDEHFGQTGWLTADEQDRLIARLGLAADARVLDVACGSGGPSLRLAQRTGCQVVGIDIHEQGVANATAEAKRAGLAGRARFQRHDANDPLPFPDASFDAIVCVDAINHLADRAAVLGEWARVLVPGGRLAFTDPITVTGPLTNEEIAIRGSLGFFLFVPAGYDARVIAGAGLDLVEEENATANMAEVAGRWHRARAAHADELRRLEGDADHEAQQRFYEVASRIAREGRLSRFIFLARKPGAASQS
jgi:SAM-dependent methyltransferase